MAKVESELIYEAYMEAKEAPKGKHYTKGGHLRKGDADSDGRGGPKFRSDPTYVNPNDDEEIPEEDDLGLGHGTPSMIRVTSIGSTTPHSRVRHIPNVRGVAEDETVYIQAGEIDDDCDHDHDQDDYDGEVDMARADLLKAAEYSSKLFDHIANVDSLDGWVAAKITKASDYLSSVFHHLDYQDNHEQVEDAEDEDVGIRTLKFDDISEDPAARDTGFEGA